MKKFLSIFVVAGVLSAALPVMAAETVAVPKQSWPHQGVTGTYDKAALQRGFQVYKEVCAACHSMKQLSYRNLEALGYTPDEVKAIAAEYTVIDGPNDDGEMFERTARPSDRFKAPFANDNAARSANGGALPVDLSLVAKSRKGGADYIYALLTGYENPPAGTELLPGMYWNRYFAGHQISMAPPLMDGQVTYADGTSATVQQAARDLAQFLSFAAEPHMEQRKRMGLKVFLFLLAFTGVMYAVKRKIWSGVE